MDTVLSEASFRCNNEDEFWFEMMFKVSEFVSVNNLHGINTVTKVIFDQPWVIKFKREMADQIVAADPRGKCYWITTTNTYYLANTFILKQNYFMRDLDNMQKVTQDCIANALNINDSRIIENHNYKAYKPNSDVEYLITRFGISHYNYKQFY